MDFCSKMSILTEKFVVADQANVVCVTERERPSYSGDPFNTQKFKL